MAPTVARFCALECAPGSVHSGRHLNPYRLSLYALLSPYLIGVTVLVGVPMALSAALAFTAYDGLSAPAWIGLANFRDLVHDQMFVTAVANSVAFVALTVPLRVVIALGLALLLNGSRRGIGLYRVAVYVPTVVPGVAYALVWLWIFNPLYGPLAPMLASVGLPTPAWLTDSRTALPALALIALFQIGEGFVVLLAGLRAIPEDCYHASALDGAGRLATLRHVTLPLLAPWLLLLTIRDIIVTAQSTFTPALVMTGGGPYYATLFVPLLMYETAFDRLRFGQGAAMTVLLLAVVATLIAVTYRAAGGWGYEDEV
jgi:multiple sugar transport system permease protein